MSIPSHYNSCTADKNKVVPDSSTNTVTVTLEFTYDPGTDKVTVNYGSSADSALGWTFSQDSKLAEGLDQGTYSELLLGYKLIYDKGSISLVTPGTDPWD